MNEQILRDTLAKAQQALDDYLKPKVELAVDTPLIVWDAGMTKRTRHFSHFDIYGKACCFESGRTSKTKVGENDTATWSNYKIDHSAPPILNWLPIDDDVVEATLYLVKDEAGEFFKYYGEFARGYVTAQTGHYIVLKP